MIVLLDLTKEKIHEFPSWDYIRDNGGLKVLIPDSDSKNLYGLDCIYPFDLDDKNIEKAFQLFKKYGYI